MTEESGLSREEVLAGLPARRAHTLIYLIERAAARLGADREVRAMALLGERSAENRELDWVEAFALGREPPVKPSIQQIEASAGRWVSLVPDSPQIRAAVAITLGGRYGLSRRLVPGIRAALGLDTEPVARAFEDQAGHPIATLWSRPGPFELARWIAGAPGRWLERTSPFRASAALTFLLSMGQTVVIVPLAVATVGPAAGAASIAVIGLLALAATGAIAEAATRSGEIRYRGGFFGRLVISALGAKAGSVPALLGIAGVALPTLSAFIGLALLLELVVPLPAPAWALLLAIPAIAVPLQGRRTASFGGLMSFGVASIALLFVLSLLVLVTAAVDGDLVAPSLGPPSDLSLELALGVIIGVLLGSYADPVYTVQIGRIVLPRDADGSGYIRGSIAGMAAFVVLTAVFSAAVLLSVPSGELAAEDGSALNPLSERFGAVAAALGLAVGVGLFGIRLYGNAIALFDFVNEQLPGELDSPIVLRRGRGRVLLTSLEARDERFALAYRGLERGRPVLTLIRSTRGRSPLTTEHRLPATGQRETISSDDPGSKLTISVLSADEDVIHLALDTTMAISYDTAPYWGPGVAESLLADDEHAALAAWLTREGLTTATATAKRFGWSAEEARRRLEDSVKAGRAVALADDRFGARLGARRGRELDPSVWARLGAAETDDGAIRTPEPGTVARLVGSSYSRAVLGSIPVAALAALSAVLLAAGTASVSGPIRIVGVIAFATISGVLPPLLLAAARRRSDAAGARGGFLVGRALMALTGFTAVAVLVLHATVLWSDPAEQALAAIASLFAFAAVVLAVRDGSFHRAMLVELRQDGERTPVRIRCEEDARPLDAKVQLAGHPVGSAELDLEARWSPLTVRGRSDSATELRVAAQRLDRSGSATALELSATMAPGDAAAAAGEESELSPGTPVHLDEIGGIASFETGHAEWTLVVRPDQPEAPAETSPGAGDEGGPRRRGARPGSPLDKL
jgi:hypothetical protein